MTPSPTWRKRSLASEPSIPTHAGLSCGNSSRTALVDGYVSIFSSLCDEIEREQWNATLGRPMANVLTLSLSHLVGL